MATIVLVPGAWLGGWVWQRVTPLLRAQGHDVHALTLTGLGDRAHLATPETGLSTHVQDIVAALEAEELSDVVLVGHSYAGVPITGAAERAPERIARLVYLAGVVLPPGGGSVYDAMPPGAREGIEAASDGSRIPFALDEPEFAQYYPHHGLSENDLRWLRAHVAGHPIGSHRESIELREPRAAAIPRAYIRCTGDIGAPPVPAGWDYHELQSGHWPMVTNPAELADLLGRIAAGSA